MFKIPARFSAQLVYIVVLPVFFMLFSLVYNPFGIKEYYMLGGKGYGFHLVILTCILLVSVLITRSILLLLLKRSDMKAWSYGVFCVIEVAVASAFMALYTNLFQGGSQMYFQTLGDCGRFAGFALVYPYIFLFMRQLLKDKDSEIERKEAGPSEGLMKFLDEHKRLKLTVEPESVLSIGAEFNYIKVSYLEGQGVKEFLLRNSMKSQEANAAEFGLVRCHRSYFVNPKHVKVLSRDKDGTISALLDTSEPRRIPVSKQYYDQLSALL